MKYVLVFGLLALALLFNASQVSPWLLKIPLLSGALCFAGVALAYAGLGSKVFLKSKLGRLPVWSWMIFWPYHLMNLLALKAFQRKARSIGDLFTEIEENVWLGAQLNEADALGWYSKSFSVLDVASELSENQFFRSQTHYRNLPTLDRNAPSLKDLNSGAAWILKRSQQERVYVHCALGHGRSATFVGAYLLLRHPGISVEDTLKAMADKRPSIDLSPVQMKVLRDFAHQRVA